MTSEAKFEIEFEDAGRWNIYELDADGHRGRCGWAISYGVALYIVRELQERCSPSVSPLANPRRDQCWGPTEGQLSLFDESA